MTEICSHCNGQCFTEGKDEKIFCEFCGGYGVNSWLGNMIGKPDCGETIYEVVLNLSGRFRFEPYDSTCIEALNKGLEDFFQNTRIKVIFDNYDKKEYMLYFKVFRRQEEIKGLDPIL